LPSEENSPAERGAEAISSSGWLKGWVRNKVDLWKASDRLNVNPSTIQKIVEGRPVSRSIARKIDAAFQEGLALDGAAKGRASNHSTVERLMEVYRLYKEERSLRTVGKKLGLCRERVRQLLERGSEIGLFRYPPLNPPLPPQGKTSMGEDRSKPAGGGSDLS